MSVASLQIATASSIFLLNFLAELILYFFNIMSNVTNKMDFAYKKSKKNIVFLFFFLFLIKDFFTHMFITDTYKNGLVVWLLLELYLLLMIKNTPIPMRKIKEIPGAIYNSNFYPE